MEGPVASGTQRFLQVRLRLSREWNFQSQKTLRKFFKSFSFKCSGNWPRRLACDLTQSRKMRVLHFMVNFFKKLFEFSLDLFVTIHCVPCLNLFRNHSVHTQIFIFFIFSIPFHQSSSKGMGSVSFSICVTYLVNCNIPLGLCVFVVYLIVEYGYLISDGFDV